MPVQKHNKNGKPGNSDKSYTKPGAKRKSQIIKAKSSRMNQLLSAIAHTLDGSPK